MRKILHVDLNNFYASVECLNNPNYANFPLVVCGNAEERKGVVLAKNKIAKKLGIKTGMVNWEAKQLAPNLIIINANFSLYMKYSKLVRNILKKYTDQVESFGIDESWLDLTKSEKLFGNYLEIANNIKEEIKSEVGLTVSIGASYNKIFAKLGSDMADNDEIVEITDKNFKNLIWPLDVNCLLYVGKATEKKLNKINVFTIGDLAQTDTEILKTKLGKWGVYLKDFACGKDESVVRNVIDNIPFKSVGNSLTNYRDLVNEEEVKMLLTLLADSVASRCRSLGIIEVKELHLYIKNSNMESFGWNKQLSNPTISSNVFIEEAMKLFCKNFEWSFNVRGLGISVSKLGFSQHQISLDSKQSDKETKLEFAVDGVRKRFGNKSLKKAILLKDKKIEGLDIMQDHTIHPENFFKK